MVTFKKTLYCYNSDHDANDVLNWLLKGIHNNQSFFDKKILNKIKKNYSNSADQISAYNINIKITKSPKE